MKTDLLGASYKLFPLAEEAARWLIHSWICYGPKQVNHFDPDSFPSGALQNVANGVLTAMLNDGVKDFAGLLVWFANAPDGVRDELIECTNGFAPQPTDCGPAINKLFDYHRALSIEKLTDKLAQALSNSDPTKPIINQLAKVEKSHYKPYQLEPEHHEHSESVGDIFEDGPSPASDRILDMPFRLLGSCEGMYLYLPDNGMSIIALTAAGHSGLNLMQLAPLQVWESAFPAKDGCKWQAAANALIQCNQALPQYDRRAVRGRGCWIDGDDVVYHAGDKISVNGSLTSLHAFKSPSRAIYEAGLPIRLDTADAARNTESVRLIELCESLSWDRPLFGKLLAGWMALAPVSGALSWRPHIWITGASGSGKSWIMANIVAQLAGETAVYVQGNTSEAGIRGRLKSDALPVLFDEAESENQKSGNRMEGVIELARQASSEGGGGIIKGTQTGGSITYLVRSLFCFSSIGVAAVKKADTSRISVLNLRKADDTAQFETVKAIFKETVAKPDYCARIRARSIKFAMVIRKNCEVFSNAAVEFTGDKRSADQIGSLLAGAYSLVSVKEITIKAARQWLSSQDWSDYRIDPIDSDENQCLTHLLSAQIRVERSTGIETITIDEAIERARLEIVPGPEGLVLMRNGIKIEGETFAIANQHSGLERIYRDTPWSGAKWRGQLLRVKGAESAKKPVRFGPMSLARAVILPFSD